MNYETTSSVYDILDILYFRSKKRSPRTALLKAIPGKPVKVLDLCAGTLSNSILIAQNLPQAEITALDSSAGMLEAGAKKIREKGLENIKTIVADACKTGFADSSFDVILLSLVLHELSESLRQAMLNEARRLLSENGMLIIIEWEQPVKIGKRLMFSLIKLSEPKGFKAFLSIDLPAYFRGFGFRIREVIGCDYTNVIILNKQAV